MFNCGQGCTWPGGKGSPARRTIVLIRGGEASTYIYKPSGAIQVNQIIVVCEWKL